MVKFPVYLNRYVFVRVLGQRGLSKPSLPRSDAAERGIRSGSTLFATHPALFKTRQHVIKGTMLVVTSCKYSGGLS